MKYTLRLRGAHIKEEKAPISQPWEGVSSYWECGSVGNKKKGLFARIERGKASSASGVTIGSI